MQWSRPEISHDVRNLAKMMGQGDTEASKAMYRLMEHCVGMPNRGVTLRPEESWDGTKYYKSIINGSSNSDYARDPDTRKSVSGTMVSVNGALTQWRSATQKHVTLLFTKAAQAAAVTCAQDMIHQKHLLESMELQVEMPMILEVDNQGTVDLANKCKQTEANLALSGGRNLSVFLTQTILHGHARINYLLYLLFS